MTGDVTKSLDRQVTGDVTNRARWEEVTRSQRTWTDWIRTLFVGRALQHGHSILQTLDNPTWRNMQDNNTSHEGQTILKESHGGSGRVHLSMRAVACEACSRERTSAGDSVAIVI